MKGNIERFFGEIARKYCDKPGRTGNNPVTRGNYDPAKHADLSLEEARVELTRWIVDVYHNDNQKGLMKLTPLQAWKRYSANRKFRIPSQRALTLATSIPHKKIYDHKLGAINWNNLHYRSKELHDLASRPGSKQEFWVKRAYDDLIVIYVFDPMKKIWIEAPCENVDHDRLRGLTVETVQFATDHRFDADIDDNDAADGIFHNLTATAESLDGTTLRRYRQFASEKKLLEIDISNKNNSMASYFDSDQKQNSTVPKGTQVAQGQSQTDALARPRQDDGYIRGHDELARYLGCTEQDARKLTDVAIKRSGPSIRIKTGAKLTGNQVVPVYELEDIEQFQKQYISMAEIAGRSTFSQEYIMELIFQRKLQAPSFSAKLKMLYLDRATTEELLRLNIEKKSPYQESLNF